MVAIYLLLVPDRYAPQPERIGRGKRPTGKQFLKNIAPGRADYKLIILHLPSQKRAHVAELVDVQVSEACGSCPVGVRVSPCALIANQKPVNENLQAFCFYAASGVTKPACPV